MNRLMPCLLTVAALASCAKSTTKPTAQMKGPSGVALFRGYGADAPGTLRQLVAVANTRGDDLRVIDAVTDKVLLGPTLVAALTIPTESRPTLIAAGRLEDLDASGTGVADLPDLLVVAPHGLVSRPGPAGQFAAAIQVVVTWNPAMRVDRTIDLGDLAPDATITALAVIPEVRPDGSRQPGAARVVIGLSDGGLLTALATRAVGSEAIVVGDPAIAGLGFTRQDLAFTPLDLAFPPPDLAFPPPDPAPAPGWTRLYVATTDPIPGPGGTLGVAELDVTAAPGAWPIRALSARVGTTRVAATGVAPFVDNADPRVATIPDFDQFGPVVPRVYASVDLAACGRDRSMPCGVAIIDPVAGGLAPDPAGELPYQAPLQLDGEVVSLAVSGPPQVSDRPGYVQLAPASGRRWTQSMGAISSSVGRVYLADLSHFALANDVSTLAGSSRARVDGTSSVVPSLSSNTIGLWLWFVPIDDSVPWPLFIDVDAVFGVGVTPGYTPSDTWAVTYQGILPGLGNRLAVARVSGGAGQPPAQVALQDSTGLPAPNQWRSVVRVYDPRLAIQPKDIVVVGGFPSGTCPLGPFEMEVTALLPPTADAPGGAIALAVPPGTQPINPGQAAPADPRCLNAGDTAVSVTVRSWGYVLTGERTGYGGRPSEVQDPRDGTPPFELKYENEDLLSCPIMPDQPEAWPPPAADVAACEADVVTCRATCERLALARRARRLFYVTNRCSEEHETSCYNTWIQLPALVNGKPQPLKLPAPLVFPLPKGPVLTFKLGVQRDEGGFAPPERGAYLAITTGSGYVPSARVPITNGSVSGAALPGRVILHDRTSVTGLATDGIRGFAAFVDNLVLEFGSGQSAQNSTTIR